MSVRVMTMVWDAALGTPARKLDALKLADCANDRGESIYPSVSTIAAVTGLSTRTVRRDWAKAKGWLYEELRSSGGSHEEAPES